jgi:serine/threonine-protein kinase HipA
MALPDAEIGIRRQAEVLFHGEAAGRLQEVSGGFRFSYHPEWVRGSGPAVSASLPVRVAPYESLQLFPFFQGLLSEGELRRVQMRRARLDESDAFGLLLATCREDAAGAVTVRPVPEDNS